MVARSRPRSLAWQIGKTVLCVTIPMAHVSAFTPMAFPAIRGIGGHHQTLRVVGLDDGLRQKQARGGIDPQVKNNWWRKSVSKRPALRMSEPAADGLFVADPLASSATNVIATPAIDPLETSSSTLVVQKERGIKKVFEDMATKMTIPQATALLIVVVALTGVSFPLVKYVSTAFDSTTILAGRFLVASLCLIPWLEFNKKLLVAGLETGAWLSAGLLAQAMCLAGGTSAGVCSFFASMSCIVCPFLEAWSGVRLTAQSWVAATLAVTGTGFLCLGNGALPTSGDLLGLLQPVLLGIYLFRTERRMEDIPGKAMELTALQSLMVFLVIGGGWLLGASALAATGGGAGALVLPPLSEWSSVIGAQIAGLATKLPQLAGLVFIGVFSSAFVIAAQTMVVTKLSSSKTSLMFATEPLFAAAIAWFLLGEGFGLNMVVGGALAITACVTASSNTFYSKLAGAGAAVKRLVTGGKKGGGGEGAKGASGRY